MKKNNLKHKIILLLLVSTIAVLVGQAFEENFKRILPEGKPFRSVSNEKISGLSALSTIAKHSGLDCQMWLAPYRRLSEVKGILCVVQPEEAWKEADWREVLAWVAKGNALFFTDDFYTCYGTNSPCIRALRKLQLQLTWHNRLERISSANTITNQSIIYENNAPELAHVKELYVSGHCRLIGGHPLVFDKKGAYITTVKYGAGKIWMGTVPDFCDNVRLKGNTNYDNFQFMINCFRTAGNTVLFDEHCHGFSRTGNVFVYLSQRIPGLIIAQLLLIILVALIGSLQRFGPVKLVEQKRFISDIAYVRGLANVYRRAHANLAALEIITKNWKTRLCKMIGLSPRANNDEIVTRSADILDTITTERFLSDYELAMNSKNITKAQLINLVKQCDSLDKELRS